VPEAVPDETTICALRQLREAHNLGSRLFEEVLAYLEAQGLRIGCRTILDATISTAPRSTKNASKTRDPDMRQPKSGSSGTSA
jgi:transposase, IS5 family